MCLNQVHAHFFLISFHLSLNTELEFGSWTPALTETISIHSIVKKKKPLPPKCYRKILLFNKRPTCFKL